MVLYAIPYEKDISNRPLRCPVDPFAILLTHPKSRRKITHPLLARCLRRHLLRGKKRLPLAAFAPRLPSVVYRLLPFFRRFRLSGLWHLILKVLRAAERNRAGKDPQPTATILDSQSVKTVEESAYPSGYDAHKNLKGRKRHLLVDTPRVFRSRFTSVRPTYKIGSGRSVFWPD